jgi:uncharacterized protein involved in cysteine biosynthesis
MLNAISKALGQIGDPRFKRVILFGLAGSIAVFFGLGLVIWFAVAAVPWASLPIIGDAAQWLGEWFDVLGGIGLAGLIGLLTYFLFPPVMTAIVGLFLEDICEAVEGKHYPRLGQARGQTVTEAVFSGIRFLGIVVLINLIAFPAYITLLIVLGAGAALYYAVNGYLVGREFYEVVALRRLKPHRAEQLRRRHKGRITLFGILFVFLMTVPILNLIAPVLAAAAMVHFFEGLPGRKDFPDDPPDALTQGDAKSGQGGGDAVTSR